jgi:hypothetical protein
LARLATAVWLSIGAQAWAANASLYQAIQLHQEGDFTRARDALAKLVEDPQLSEDDHATAAEYLASSELSLKNTERARSVLRTLIQRQPNTHLDPNLFFPEVIALAEQVRIELDREATLRAKESGTSTGTRNPALAQPAQVTAAGDARSWAKWPLIAGGVLLVAAGALEAVAYSQYVVLQQSTPPSSNNPVSYETTGKNFQTAAQVTGIVGGVCVIVGGGMYLFGGSSAQSTVSLRADVGLNRVVVSGKF